MSDDGPAHGVDPDDLTPVAQDYLKVIWSATEWGGPPLGTGDLATRLGSSPATVTETVRRLAGQGLVEYVPYRPVRLTESGTARAIAMVRRHRILETYLVEALGYGWDEVHEEAERLEHAASSRLIDRLDARLGHPEADPHGDPIPRPDGTTSLPPGAELLADARSTGPWEVLRVSDADPELLERATALGLVPGRVLELVVVPDATGRPQEAEAGPRSEDREHLAATDATVAVAAPDVTASDVRAALAVVADGGRVTAVPLDLAAAVRGRPVGAPV